MTTLIIILGIVPIALGTFLTYKKAKGSLISGIIFIALGTFSMYYFPYHENLQKEKNIKDSGEFSKIINMDLPLICMGNDSTCFLVIKEDYVPFITYGGGNGMLDIPNKIKGELIGVWIQDKKINIRLSIYNKNQELISYISGNQWVVHKSNVIDCNYDLDNFEVVNIKNDNIEPLLQIQLKQDRMVLAFETYLKDGSQFFWGNASIGGTNSLTPLFKYPSNKNLGKRKQ